MRLRRADLSAPGYRRRRHGRGFAYLDGDNRALSSHEAERCRQLVIPPAWTDVWICVDPAGHIQATGVDAAGRRQYLYHPDWRARRDRRKFTHVLEVAARLPRLRRRVRMDLGQAGLVRQQVLALATRLLDRGLFRVGGDEYANGEDPTFGLATLRANHVRVGADVTFCYTAKGGLERTLIVHDRVVRAVVTELKKARRGRDRLLAYRNDAGEWCEVHAGDINEYLRRASGVDMTAKDLRTWHGTLRAAVALARSEPPGSKAAARRAIAAVMREVADDLGNTPAVARASYVDPRVVEAFLRGDTVRVPSQRCHGPAAERAVLELLSD
jgi:DNA topoisomerase I